MKKKIISIFIIFLLGIFTFNNVYEVKADSGFGGSYGGSSSSGGSSWSSSSSSYSSSSSSNNRELRSYEKIIIIIIFILVFLIYVIGYINNKNFKTKLTNYKELNIEEIKKVIPRFNLEKFRMETYAIYKNIQVAWMNFDEEELRKYLTDEIFNMYVSQLKTLKIKEQRNIMKDFNLYDFKVIDVKKEGKNIIVKTNMQISCLDYIIDTKNNKTIKGYSNKKVLYNYEITFIKTNKYKVKNKYCPNCGASITNNASNECEYCKATIVSNNHNWVMSKKEVLEQFYKNEL